MRLGKLTFLLIAILSTTITSLATPPVRHAIIDAAGGPYCVAPPAQSGTLPLRRIALVDSLASQFPNPDFVEKVKSSALETGYVFDYFSPSTTTIDFFSNLPGMGYSIIILRSHASYAQDDPGFATSESYSQYRRVLDQMLNRLEALEVDGHVYFDITPSFVKHDMCGSFQGTLILAMYCSGTSPAQLGTNTFSEALIEKGAKAYIGWDRQVTVTHTDLAFEALATLLMNGQTVSQAIQSVMTTIGPDPAYGARLAAYPDHP